MGEESDIPDLVPWDLIPAIVHSPKQILIHQARLLREKTEDRLRASVERNEVITEQAETVMMGFIVEAPEIQYSFRLFKCYHDKLLPYPTTVEFSGFEPEDVTADTEKRLLEIVSDIFRHPTTRTLFQSVLARVAELKHSDSDSTET